MSANMSARSLSGPAPANAGPCGRIGLGVQNMQAISFQRWIVAIRCAIPSYLVIFGLLSLFLSSAAFDFCLWPWPASP